MGAIPYLGAFINRVIKEQTARDVVDHLNYWYTATVMAFMSMAISAKQYFGSPIQCWIPAHFKATWERYAESICLINNLYHVPWGQEIPTDPAHRGDQLNYYRWVPILLALGALLFYIPNYVWNMLHKQTTINPRGILREARVVASLHGDKHEEGVEKLSKMIKDSVSVFSEHPIYGRRTWTAMLAGRNATLMYLGIKALYICNIICQMLFWQHIFKGEFFRWGYETIGHIANGREWTDSDLFPRVVTCDFQVRKLANLDNVTVQCVVMLNMINEKVFLMLWMWYLVLGTITTLNFFYTLFYLIVPYYRRNFIYFDRILNQSGMDKKKFKNFVNEVLHPDGILLLHFIQNYVSGRLASEVIVALLKEYNRQQFLESPGKKSSNDYGSFGRQGMTDSLGKFAEEPKGNNYGLPMHPTAPDFLDDAYLDGGATLRVGDKGSRAPLIPSTRSDAPGTPIHRTPHSPTDV